ncbi:DUF6082 family protein [Allorhizocola rhizosphaerae]|uniref:DUF6082 family protein n=1 Tax=Allorhizocola rhizosphaerae TaxID=1872709 RepID=UPI000E3CB99D|nr:DUF6082 family protein [Allorhizocola rhizosphaerae]
MAAAWTGVLAALVITLLAPILIAVLHPSVTWIDLSNVGQAYGGVAAVISALALGGIAISIFLQWRQLRLAQTIALRERTFELLKFALEHPDLLPMLSGSEQRVRLYANLTIGHQAMWWDLGAASEESVRLELRPLFELDVVRSWWAERGPSWSAGHPTAHRRRFHEILDDECRRAESRGREHKAQHGEPDQAREDRPTIGLE